MTEFVGPDYEKRFGDDRIATIIPLTFGRARITIAREGARWYLDGW